MAQAQAFPGFLAPARRDNPHDPRCIKPGKGKFGPQFPTPTCTPLPVIGCRGPVAYPSLSLANNAFACDFFAAMAQANGPASNLTLSPFSVSTAMTMAWLGARGATASQMASVLHLQAGPDAVADQSHALLQSLSQSASQGGLSLTVADSLWMNQAYSFQPAYLSLLQSGFGALETPLSFGDTAAVAQQVDQWVAGQTDQMIQNILSPDDVSVGMTAILANAVYFKGPWGQPFQVNDTHDQAFTRGDGSVVMARMMMADESLYYHAFPDAQVAELPYQGGAYSMLLVLPTAGGSPASLLAGLSPAKLDAWVNSLCQQRVQLSLPKLALNTGPIDLVTALRQMGMQLAFGPEADFSGIAPAMALDKVKHQAVVKVDEQGTKAAGTTVVTVVLTGIATPITPPPAVMTLDHPFLFAIRERATGAILFLAQVADPTVP